MPNVFLNSVTFVDANTGWVVGSAVPFRGNPYALVLKTSDGGVSWTRAGFDGFVLSAAVFINPNIGTAVGGLVSNPPFFGIIVRTTDGGTTWTTQHLEPDCGFNGVSFLRENIGTVVGLRETVLRTATGGD
jgi:photosystem II stability/assembly factor-like uncharacterized protein